MTGALAAAVVAAASPAMFIPAVAETSTTSQAQEGTTKENAIEVTEDSDATGDGTEAGQWYVYKMPEKGVIQIILSDLDENNNYTMEISDSSGNVIFSGDSENQYEMKSSKFIYDKLSRLYIRVTGDGGSYCVRPELSKQMERWETEPRNNNLISADHINFGDSKEAVSLTDDDKDYYTTSVESDGTIKMSLINADGYIGSCWDITAFDSDGNNIGQSTTEPGVRETTLTIEATAGATYYFLVNLHSGAEVKGRQYRLTAKFTAFSKFEITSPDELELTAGGDSSEIRYSGNASEVSFFSSDESVATVSVDGYIIPVGAGKATITVKDYGDYGDYQIAGATKTIDVTVKEPEKREETVKKPGRVTGVKIRNVKGAKVKVSWKKRSDAASYTLSYRTGKKGKWKTRSTARTSMTISVKKNIKVYVRVNAVNDAGKGKYSRVVSKKTDKK